MGDPPGFRIGLDQALSVVDQSSRLGGASLAMELA